MVRVHSGVPTSSAEFLLVAYPSRRGGRRGTLGLGPAETQTSKPLMVVIPARLFPTSDAGKESEEFPEHGPHAPDYSRAVRDTFNFESREHHC